MITVAQAHLPVTAVTHPGSKGKNNEDRYAVTAYQVYAAQQASDSPPLPALLAVVADGIGGHRAGEVAAGIAVEAICQFMAGSDAARPAESLHQALVHANQLIYQQAQHDSRLAGMGTTCACCWIIGERLVTANVGDSRIYLLRSGAISQLSTDHTWIQEAIDSGLLTAEQAAQHPNMHVIRRYLGSKDSVEPELRQRLGENAKKSNENGEAAIQLLPGDCLILCTDGLTDLVKDQEILAAISTHALHDALDRLVDLANQRGGHDNITIIAIRVPEDGQSAPGKNVAVRRRKMIAGCLGAIALLTLVAMLITAATWWYLRTGNLPTSTPTSPALLLTEPAANPPGLLTDAPTTTSVLPTPTDTPIGLESATPPPGSTLTPWPTNTIAP